MNRRMLGVWIPLAAAIIGGCASHEEGPPPLSSPTFDRALALLQTQAHSPDPVVRANCIEAVQASRDPRAMEIIEQGLHDDQWVVRFSAAMTAGKRKATAVRPVLNTLVTADPNGSVRVACIYALRMLGDTTHMNDLAKALVDPDPSTRANTALVLGMMGDDSAIPLLKGQQNEPDIRVKFELTSALARLGDTASQQVIVAWAVDKYAEDQWNAMTVCADLPREVGLSPLLLGLEDVPAKLPPDVDRNLVQDLTTRRQLVAARSLAKLHIGSGAKLALDNLKSPVPNFRALAALALGEMLDSRQAPGLEPLLSDPDDSVKRAAAAAVISIYARAAAGT